MSQYPMRVSIPPGPLERRTASPQALMGHNCLTVHRLDELVALHRIFQICVEALLERLDLFVSRLLARWLVRTCELRPRAPSPVVEHAAQHRLVHSFVASRCLPELTNSNRHAHMAPRVEVEQAGVVGVEPTIAALETARSPRSTLL